MTSDEHEVAEMSAIGTFLAEVVSVIDVNPHLRRVVVGGDDLGRFTPTGPDTFVYVLLPPPGRARLTIDQSFTWEGYEQMAEADRPVGAYYTVRRWDAARREVTMLMVRHGDEGPASAWVDRAAPGDPVALWGPRTAMPWPGGTPYVWGGGESRAMTAVRCYVRGDPGLARDQVSLVAYWRHATSPPVD